MSAETRQQTCEQRVEQNLKGRIRDLSRLWDAFCSGKDDEGDSLYDYGLSFDYVEPGTFNGQREGYFRYQLSWGGPSDEFRFYANPDLSCHRVEYWFMDWFDGAHRVLSDDDEALMLRIWDWLNEGGAARAALPR
jgi:hypothetical protein